MSDRPEEVSIAIAHSAEHAERIRNDLMHGIPRAWVLVVNPHGEQDHYDIRVMSEFGSTPDKEFLKTVRSCVDEIIANIIRDDKASRGDSFDRSDEEQRITDDNIVVHPHASSSLCQQKEGP